MFFDLFAVLCLSGHKICQWSREVRSESNRLALYMDRYLWPALSGLVARKSATIASESKVTLSVLLVAFDSYFVLSSDHL